MGHYVYKYVYDDEIIYIGKNDTDLITRIKQHEYEVKFRPYIDSEIYYIELSNKAESKALETLLINKYKPKLNIADKYSGCSFLNFEEPGWEKLNKLIQKNTAKNDSIKKDNVKRRISEINREKKKLKKELDFETICRKNCIWIYKNKNKLIFNDEEVLLELPYDGNEENLFKTSFAYKTDDGGICYTKVFGGGTYSNNIMLYHCGRDIYDEFIENFEIIIQQFNEQIEELESKYTELEKLEKELITV